MTAEQLLPQNPALPLAARAVTAALIVATLAAAGGWLHTVRELNRLAAYQSVGAEALRLAQSARAEKAPAPAIYARRWE
jgi:hypothetical protein